MEETVSIQQQEIICNIAEAINYRTFVSPQLDSERHILCSNSCVFHYKQNIVRHSVSQLLGQHLLPVTLLQNEVQHSSSLQNLPLFLSMTQSNSVSSSPQQVEMQHTTLWWNMIGQHLNTPERELFQMKY